MAGCSFTPTGDFFWQINLVLSWFVLVYVSYRILLAAYSYFNTNSFYSAISCAKKKKHLDRSHHSCRFKWPRIFKRRFWTGLIVFFYLKEYIYPDSYQGDYYEMS